MTLHPGDLFYYDENKALGVLLERIDTEGVPSWCYSLRSPFVHNKDSIKISIQQASEANFVDGVREGRLIYYAAG